MVKVNTTKGIIYRCLFYHERDLCFLLKLKLLTNCADGISIELRDKTGLVMKSILKDTRKKNKKSGNEIALALGVTRGYYHKLENLTEIPSEKRLIKLAEIFNIHPDVLLRDYELNRAYMNASNNWIGKIKIKDMSAIEAFKKEHLFDRYKLSDEEVITKFINFIALEIRDSLIKELKSEEEKSNFLRYYILDKLRPTK